MKRHKNAPTVGQTDQGAQIKNHTTDNNTFSRHCAAIHEAAHATAHRAHGIRVRSVAVYLSPHVPGAWEGWTATEMQPSVSPLSRPEDDLAVGCGYLAGHVAELLHTAPVPAGSNLDERQQAALCQQALRFKGLDVDLEAYTRALLEKNQYYLLRLARNLMLVKRIEGQRLRNLLKGVKP